MKFSTLHGGLLLAATLLNTATFAYADQQPPIQDAINTTTVQSLEARVLGDGICNPALWGWYYNHRGDGPHGCITKEDTREWSMLPAYRSGGIQNVHWKYTNDENDGECLDGWAYYTADGNGYIAYVAGRTTFVGDSNRWCALPVYRSGGVLGKQWDYCSCQ